MDQARFLNALFGGRIEAVGLACIFHKFSVKAEVLSKNPLGVVSSTETPTPNEKIAENFIGAGFWAGCAPEGIHSSSAMIWTGRVAGGNFSRSANLSLSIGSSIE